jgi:hypothetical protein
MTDRAQEELTRAIVHDAVRKYIATRHERIDLFVDRHFTLAGSLKLHRRAIGWDLLRAPANLFLAGPALSVKLASWAVRRAGNHRLAAWLAGCRLLVETDVAHEVEWLIATELLEIPCRRRDRAAYRDAIAETILADSRAAVWPAGIPNFATASYRLSKTISARAVRRPKLLPVSWQLDLALSR